MRVQTTTRFFRLTVVAAFVAIGAPACATQEIGVLSASRDRFIWALTSIQGGPVDSLAGRHDELGLEPETKDSLAHIFRLDGLAIGDRVVPPSQLSLDFRGITQSEALVAFGSIDSSRLPSEVLWLVDSVYEQPVGDFWPGDLVAVNSNVTINGEVAGNVLMLGGDLVVREAATVRGGAVVVGGILRQRGDGKIYGSVFAPAGHRRPRLSVTRAWEFEDEGVQWGPSFSYDRVDGARLGGLFAYQKSVYSPRLSTFAGYAFASKTWQYKFALEQRVMRTADLSVQASIFRLTDTEDEYWVGRHANTLYAIFAGSDYRDYYGNDGGEVGAIYKYRERGIVSLRYRNTDHRWLEAERNLWHLFRPNRDFRDNFSTVPINDREQMIDRFEQRTSAIHLSMGVEPRESEEHLKRFDATIHVLGEIAGGGLGGDFDYDRWQFFARGEWNSEESHRLTARLWYANGRRNLPPNKFFYLGGIGTLPGYSQKEFVGNEAILASAEYRFDYWPNQIFDGGILLFVDVGRATFEEDFFDFSSFKSDIGVGFAFGESACLNVAKGLDRTDRDIRLSLALWQKF